MWKVSEIDVDRLYLFHQVYLLNGNISDMNVIMCFNKMRLFLSFWK